MKALLSIALFVLTGCASAKPWLTHDLTYRDLQKNKAELVGQSVTVYAGVEKRFTGGSPPILWLSATARAHAFGPSRGNFCIWADDPSGKLDALKSWTIVRIKGVVRTDDTIEPKVMECPSTLIVSASQIEVLPSASSH